MVVPPAVTVLLVGWAVMLLYLVATLTLTSLGFEHNLYQYGGNPGVPLSDMIGADGAVYAIQDATSAIFS